MTWVNSTGGPCIVVSHPNVHLWSGIGDEKAAAKGEYLPVEDFMDPDQCHYGLACSIKGSIGLVGFSSPLIPAIVVGDEPSPITVVCNDTRDGVIIVKLLYANSEEEVQPYLDFDKLNCLTNWDGDFYFENDFSTYLLMDSSASGFEYNLDTFISFDLTPGVYHVSSMTYQPNPHTLLCLHRIQSE